jgi:L-alanine-DL-glutamate epimerase-like enolase superfamily enzyme
MIIQSVDLVRVRIPISKPYSFGRGTVDSIENIVIRMKGKDGLEGIGECCVRSLISSLDVAGNTLQKELIPAIIGMDSMDVEAVIKKLESEKWPDLGPVAAIDLALWDLNGKILGLPAYKLLGGAYQLEIPASFTLGSASPEKMAEKTLEMMEYGFRTFVVKTEKGAIGKDIERVRMVRKHVGPDVRLRLDVNASYTVEEAIRVGQGVEECGLEYIEQPIRPRDLGGLKKIAASTKVPICIDEGLEHLSDARELAESGTVKFFNIKPPQVGGLWLAKKMAAIAEDAGIACVCGGRLAFEIVRQASRHFVVSTPQACMGYAHEGPGPASQGPVASVARETLTFEDIKKGKGTLRPVDGPGLGVDLEEEVLRRYAVR